MLSAFTMNRCCLMAHFGHLACMYVLKGNKIQFICQQNWDKIMKVKGVKLTLSLMTNFRLFQNEGVCK